MLIQSENQNNIRHKLSTYVNITQIESASLNVTVQGAKLSDVAYIQQSDIDLRPLTDLKSDGFILDGSCRWYDSSESTTVTSGKVGIRGHVGQAFTVTASSSSEINAITMRVVGSGTVTANGDTFSASEFLVIPVGGRSITMTFTPSSAVDRLEVDDIQSGIVLTFNDDNLISCNLDLASDLSIINGDWQVSSIEVQGYYPYDISSAVSNMSDGTPIIYQTGYAEDMSTPRRFYVSEEVTQKNGVITVRGVDASAKLDNKVQPEVLWGTTPKNYKREIYNKMVKWVTDAKISLVSKETQPPLIQTDANEVSCIILKEGTYREHLHEWMTICNYDNFYPRFIDGGIPRMRWSRPTSQWTIYEEDVGDFELQIERRLNRIYGADADSPIYTVLERSSKKSTIASRKITKGKNLNVQYDSNYYDSVTWDKSLASAEKQTLHSLQMTAKKTTQSVKYKVASGWTTKKKRYKVGAVPTKIKKAKGYKVVTKTKNYVTVQWKEKKYVTKTKYVPMLTVKGYKVTKSEWYPSWNVESVNRLGVSAEVNTKIYGVFNPNLGSSWGAIPSYYYAFDKSNIKGSFTWKGNPHIQPRDVFTFVHLDGTEEVCTIERIETTHQGGGMSSKITYRKGVL